MAKATNKPTEKPAITDWREWEDVPDPDLVAASLEGEDGATEAIMRRHNRLLFRIARAILANDAEAEDVVQETHMKALRALKNLKDPRHLRAWLARIATNTATSHLRAQRPTASLDKVADQAVASQQSATIIHLTGAPADTPETDHIRRQARDLIEQAIDQLPDHYRTVFVLRAIEELSVKETANHLGIPGVTVKTRFHRAKRLLRKTLAETLDTSLADAFNFAGARCDRIVAAVLAQIATERPPPP